MDKAFFGGEGYIYAGIEAPWWSLAERWFSSWTARSPRACRRTEVARLQQDLVGDGWTVLRHDVPRMAVDPANTSSSVWAARSNELASVKALIKADYDADPANVKAVFLLGHVPVPYSGDLNPDAHTEHQGAWPADGFYGEMDGVWTDSTVNRTSASDPRNRNVPGDGKFDRTLASNGRATQCGAAGGPGGFGEPARFWPEREELLRQYLNKDHNFRHKLITAERRGLIDDNLG